MKLPAEMNRAKRQTTAMLVPFLVREPRFQLPLRVGDVDPVPKPRRDPCA
jgi:hypothetical protein